MSTYILRHDEASCISCLACEVHCKTNKDLGPGPDPCKIVTIGPLDVGGRPLCVSSLCPASIARSLGALRHVRLAPCSAARRTASSSSSPVYASAVRAALRLALGALHSGIRSRARQSNATTARIVWMPGYSRPASPSV